MHELNEDRKFLYRAVFSAAVKKIRSQNGKSGAFEPVRIGMIDPEDDLRCMLFVKPSSGKSGGYLVVMGCLIPETDALMSCIAYEGSLEAVVHWLEGPESLEQGLKLYQELCTACRNR